MAREKIITAVDIGSSLVHVGCAILSPDRPPRLVGAGTAPSAGVRRGQIVDISEIVAAVSDAFAEAERTAGVKLTKALVVVNGSRVELARSSGSIAISRADGVVSEDDMTRVLEEAKAVSIPKNKVIIYARPIAFTVDSETGIEDPLGMSGVRLEATVLLVLALEPPLKALEKTIGEAGRELEGWVWGPLATKRAIVSKKEADAGGAVVNIGGPTTTVSVFRDRVLEHVSTIPMGGTYVTHDIAIGLKTSLDVAERIKVEHGFAVASSISKREQVVLADWGLEHVSISRYALAQIVEARMIELFDLIAKDIQKYTKEKALPGGIMLTGGGAKLKGVVDLSKRELKLPTHVGRVREIESDLSETFDPSFSGVVGALLSATDQEQSKLGRVNVTMDPKGVFAAFKTWLQELLP